MSEKGVMIPVERIKQSIVLIRGQKIMLDRDLANLYGVETRVLNQAVGRNIKRFPDDFMFALTREEIMRISQIVTSSDIKYSKRVRVFTEQGVAMLSSVLRSERAVEVKIAIMRAFVQLRKMLASNVELSRKLKQMEKKYDEQFKIVFEAIRQLMAPTETKKKKIGFTVKEKQKAYGKSMPTKTMGEFSFTAPAFKIWINIPGDIQIKILNNVWCRTCSDITGIGSVNGMVDNLPCSICASNHLSGEEC